ncbi:hypothetical protein ACFLYQ_00540 [Chloroflexota bacterium]
MLSGLKTYLGIAWACKTPLVFLLDTEYKPVSDEILKEVSTRIKKRFKYIKEVADCDDAALLFKAAASEKKENGVGLVFGKTPRGLHAWNVTVRPDGIEEVEPQTAAIGKRKGFKPWVVII